MKRKTIMSVPPKPPQHKDGRYFTTQKIEGILVLNYWKNGILNSRYCMNMDTHEFETCFGEKWTQCTLQSAVEMNWWGTSYEISKKSKFDTDEDKQLAILPPKHDWRKNDTVIGHILDWQEDYRATKREAKEMRRIQRINDLMALIPEAPDDLEEWALRTVFRGKDYALYDRENKKWTCTACGGKFPDQPKILHKTIISCPHCGKSLEAKKLGNPKVVKDGQVLLLQRMDAVQSAARYIDVRMIWSLSGRKMQQSEAIRIIFLRGFSGTRYFMGQIPKSDHLKMAGRPQYFDDKSSGGANRRIGPCYLYPQGIREALEGTRYNTWGRLFEQTAEAGKELNYNRMMCAERRMAGVIEYLFKGGFNRLLRETIENISVYSGNYGGPLCTAQSDIRAVFGLSDRQKINRIRDCDGGEGTLLWLQWAEEKEEKIDDETLRWLSGEKIRKENVKFIIDCMSPRQIMNYVKKQQAGGYKGKTAKSVLEQWADYLNMCQKAGKDTSDEMVYRPRDLKYRHDEMVEEIRKHQMIEQIKRNKEANEEYARKMREKFPGAEENLEAVRKKFEYQDEEYMIHVPKSLTEIAQEGNALHHCAGASERYYERIMQNETYICFLRRTAEPDIPFYTIEVEPGGTIRQHRSYFDEEPGIQEIRSFLRGWQQEVKKRLKDEDHRLAEESKKKRISNIEELKAKNNTRVLKGLMEDFMEAM